MKYFINDSQEVFAFELGFSEQGGLIAISEEEALELASLPVPVFDLGFSERKWRDAHLSEVIWLRERHRDQREIEVSTVLSDAHFKELLIYIQSLRDWPQSADFPNGEYRPTAPLWLAGQTV